LLAACRSSISVPPYTAQTSRTPGPLTMGPMSFLKPRQQNNLCCKTAQKREELSQSVVKARNLNVFQKP